jgi:hypothetical protein
MAIHTYTQGAGGFEYKPYFSAVVVKNADSSMRWYSTVFGLKIKNELSDTPTTYHIFIMESPVYMLEILQLKGSLALAKIKQGMPQAAEILGHFKVGFIVPDMDACLKQLAKLKIDTGYIWTENSTGKRNFIIKDPDGNLLQFFE